MVYFIMLYQSLNYLRDYLLLSTIEWHSHVDVSPPVLLLILLVQYNMTALNMCRVLYICVDKENKRVAQVFDICHCICCWVLHIIGVSGSKVFNGIVNFYFYPPLNV